MSLSRRQKRQRAAKSCRLWESVCVCVCPHCAKWKQRENRGTHLYNGVRTQPASGSLHLSITAPGCTHAHALWHTHTHSLFLLVYAPTPLTKSAVICHVATGWAVSDGLLSALGSLIMPLFEGQRLSFLFAILLKRTLPWAVVSKTNRSFHTETTNGEKKKKKRIQKDYLYFWFFCFTSSLVFFFTSNNFPTETTN